MIRALVKGRHIWWKKPHMRTDAELDMERKASWLELFWDLIFVAVIAELSHYISLSVHGVNGIFHMILLYVPVWWIWNGITFYNERYEMDNVRHRVFMFITMPPMAGMAYTIHGALDELAIPFAAYNVIARLLLSYMWMTACHTDLEKSLSKHFTVGLLVSSSFFTASIFLPQYRVLLWSVAILADLSSPLFSLDIQAKLPRISTSHLPERFGLLIILTLGETVISSVKGLTSIKDLSWLTWLISTESLLITFMIWWLYVDHVMYRVFKPHLHYALAWCYLHLPLSIAIIALSACVSIITEAGAKEALQIVATEQQWQLVVFVASAIVIIILINLVSRDVDYQHNVINFRKEVNKELVIYKLLGVTFIVGCVALFHRYLSPLYLLTVTVGGLAIPLVYGLNVWVKAHLQKMQISNHNKLKPL